jgi:hypothetical protein
MNDIQINLHPNGIEFFNVTYKRGMESFCPISFVSFCLVDKGVPNYQ